jgi:hypothetical protein
MARNRVRSSIGLLLVAIGASGREPLIPHEIRDMILVGHEGVSRSTVSRRVFMVGDYVYVSGEPGLQTIDARDPAVLRLVDDWPASSAKMNGADVKDDVLYVANWSPDVGLVLFDLADPAHPAHVKTVATRSHSWEVDRYGDFLHVAIDDGIITGIETYDIASPRAPSFISFLSLDDRLVGNAARYGRYLYTTHKRWMYVYDVTNMASPQRIREIEFNALGIEVRVRGDHLFMLSRAIEAGEQGGVRVYSLAQPASPVEIEFWEQTEPRDMHFQGDFLIVPASGSGIYTLDVSDPADIREIAHWYVEWPDMGHGGYPVTATGSGNYVYIGTTGGNNPACEDFDQCAYFGARLYSVRISIEPPRIAPVGPDTAVAGQEYFRQLALLEGDPAPAWSVVRGPSGIAVDGRGLVEGWTPSGEDVGKEFTIEIQAANSDGSARVAWSVTVAAAPEDLIALYRFESDAEGWSLGTWQAGPYASGAMEWKTFGGNSGGAVECRGSGATNNEDTCNREGGIMTRLTSTEGREKIRIEYDCMAYEDSPPGASGIGTCPVLEGTSEDKLAVYVSEAGVAGPWQRVQMLAEGAGLPAAWTREVVDLSGVAGAGDNPEFAVRFQWQFNTENEGGRIDNVAIRGAPAGVRFRRGDANGDGDWNLADPITILGYLFADRPVECEKAADANGSGGVDIADAVYSLAYDFAGGPPPPAPYPDCGRDDADALACERHASCP